MIKTHENALKCPNCEEKISILHKSLLNIRHIKYVVKNAGKG